MKFPGADVALFTNINTGFWLEAEFNSAFANGFVFETVNSASIPLMVKEAISASWLCTTGI